MKQSALLFQLEIDDILAQHNCNLFIYCAQNVGSTKYFKLNFAQQMIRITEGESDLDLPSMAVLTEISPSLPSPTITLLCILRILPRFPISPRFPLRTNWRCGSVDRSLGSVGQMPERERERERGRASAKSVTKPRARQKMDCARGISAQVPDNQPNNF